MFVVGRAWNRESESPILRSVNTTRSRHGPGSVGWGRRVDRVRWLGPGLVLAATAIGASHLVLSPTAGALYGYSLLWLIAFSHFFKYPAFEFGPRYAVATDRSLLDGYAAVPGPRGWALWIFLIGTVIQGFSVLAGVLSVSAVVARAAGPDLSLTLWSGAIGIVTGVILWSGRFDGLSAFSKGMLIVLAVMTVVAFLATPPSPGAWRGLVPSLPAGSLVLVAALLGWMPTGLDVSVWHSMWALERRDAWAQRGRSAAHGRSIFVVARLDLWLGYGLSFGLAVMFLTLGAVVLAPSGLVPQGGAVAVTLARLYTDVLGEWAWYPFLIAAFFGMLSSTFGVMDGFPRAFAGAVSRLWSGGVSEDRLQWSFMWGALGLALIEIALLPDPVLLVTVAAVASFLLAPLTYALNYYCVTRQIDDRSLRPSPALRLWALIGIICMTVATLLFVYVRFLA